MTIFTQEARRWYVGVLKPGATSKAGPRRGLPEDRADEAVIERSLIDAGFDHYLPRMTHRFRHHRSNKIIARRRILFTGYVFVAAPTPPARMDWPSLGRCDGIGGVLQMDGWPLECPRGYVETMRTAEAEGHYDKDDAGPESGRGKQRLARHRFAVGTVVRPKRGPFAGFNGLVEDVTGQGLIKVAIEIFGRATPVEIKPEQLEVV